MTNLLVYIIKPKSSVSPSSGVIEIQKRFHNGFNHIMERAKYIFLLQTLKTRTKESMYSQRVICFVYISVAAGKLK